MTEPADPPQPGRMAGRLPLQQWGLLVVGSAVLAALLETVALPAALLLGPMIAGIALATNGGSIRPPKLPVDAAGRMAKMPHIRLDRALEFLLGDRFA